jgi:hypothetical protein
MTTIRAEDVEALQQSWGQALMTVGRSASWEEAHERAVALVEAHYLLEDGSLLFCPTKASHAQFRRTLEGAVSYFVGRDDRYPEDQGFALTLLQGVRFENTGIVIRGDSGISMGNYFFLRADGSEFKAEYSLVFVRNSVGELKIQLHHSALPFQG